MKNNTLCQTETNQEPLKILEPAIEPIKKTITPDTQMPSVNVNEITPENLPKLKKCNKCGEIKDLIHFYIRSDRINKPCSQCKKCVNLRSSINQKKSPHLQKLRSQRWYIKHKDKLKQLRLGNKWKREKYKGRYTGRYSVRIKQWHIDNRERLKPIRKNYAIKNADKLKLIKKQYRIINRDSIREKLKLKRKTNINYRLSINLRKRLYDALHKNFKAGSAVRDLGCSLEKLKIHLETQFKNGMSWDNYGINGWHIDHIIPLASFNLSNRSEFLNAFHYTNLQPLWWYDNLKKGKNPLTMVK